jgi:hypothetical protein
VGYLPGRGHSWTVTFTDAKSSDDVPLMKVQDNKVTGNGGKPEVMVKTTRDGNELSGSFRLKYQGYSTGLIPFNAQPAEMKAHLEDITSIGEVEVTRSVANSITRGYHWTVTFVNGPKLDQKNLKWGTNMGILGLLSCDTEALLTTTNNDETDKCVVETHRAGTEALGGTFTLVMDSSNCDDCHFQQREETAPISVYATADEVKSALEAVGNIAEVDVVRSAVDPKDGGFTWTITYLMDENGFSSGNVPQIIPNFKQVTGTGANMTQSTKKTRQHTARRLYSLPTFIHTRDNEAALECYE